MDEFNLKLFNSICQEIIERDICKKDAIQKLSDILSDYYIVEIEKDANNNNLRQNVNKFLDEKIREGLKKNTTSSYKIQLDLFVDFMGEKNIQEITKEDIKHFLYYREDNYDINSRSSMETIRSILKVFFDWLKDEDKIRTNPVSKIKPFKVADAFVDILDIDELDELRNSCQTFRERALIEVFVSTGCLLNEISQLQLKDIDWDIKVLNINAEKEKNRIVLLSDKALKALKEYLDSRSDDCNYVFVAVRSPFRKMSNRAIQREIAAIAGRASIKKNISPKTFRHIFAKTMLRNECPMNIIQSLLGHKTYTNTSETNIRINNENIQQIAERYLNQ